MVGKKPGRFTWKNERKLMAKSGASASKIAAHFDTSVKTIRRKAKALSVTIKPQGKR